MNNILHGIDIILIYINNLLAIPAILLASSSLLAIFYYNSKRASFAVKDVKVSDIINGSQEISAVINVEPTSSLIMIDDINCSELHEFYAIDLHSWFVKFTPTEQSLQNTASKTIMRTKKMHVANFVPLNIKYSVKSYRKTYRMNCRKKNATLIIPITSNAIAAK